MKIQKIKTAKLVWRKQCTPVSEKYNDVYYSDENGLEESCYVFLQGNDLPQRLLHTNQYYFVIAETGFGTGLNFLSLWRLWQQFRQANQQQTLQQLVFISFEKHPLSLSDLILAHKHWPELEEFSLQLEKHWPKPIAGRHRIIFPNSYITLELWFGDVNQLIPELTSSQEYCVDAWFLDGFSPTKNPSMWTETLFHHMALLSRAECSFATFTSAGLVRRGLTKAGFTVYKRTGFGRKREMLTGKISPNN